MLKYDGLTVELIYDCGELIQGSTRGNGVEGENITHNVKTFKNVPLTVPYMGRFKVVGEAIIHKNDFEKMNQNLPENERYKTPRNLVSGSVRQLDSKICADRNVYFYPWDVIEGLDGYSRFNLRSDKIFSLWNCIGFSFPDMFAFNCDEDLNNLEKSILDLKNIANEKNIPIDGLVIKYNSIPYSKSLGSTSHHNNDGLALKFEDETADTTLRNIEWSMGRTGCLTPVALFDTVELDGTEVSRASLHNISIIENLQLGLGDVVSIYKANMIIPQIAENFTKSNSLEIPNTCPICGGKTEINQDNDSKVLVCTNPNCEGKLLGRFTHFVSKSAMNIDGLSESTLEKFIDKGWLETYSDIYRLDEYKTEIIAMDGFGIKSYENMWNAIQNSRKVKLENFIVALGIPQIGRTASKTISKYFNGDWYDFEEALWSIFDFTILDDFGTTMNQAIYNWHFKEREFSDLECLVSYMSFIKPESTSVNNASVQNNAFSGKKVYCTGSFASYKKEALKELLESLGAEFTSGYAKSLDYLVVGSLKGSSKEDKAKADGVKILSEDEFLQMIGEK